MGEVEGPGEELLSPRERITPGAIRDKVDDLLEGIAVDSLIDKFGSTFYGDRDYFYATRNDGLFEIEVTQGEDKVSATYRTTRDGSARDDFGGGNKQYILTSPRILDGGRERKFELQLSEGSGKESEIKVDVSDGDSGGMLGSLQDFSMEDQRLLVKLFEF